ncbi:hypothetical protein GQ457_15G020280 [Hibiscus cannabinus]
MYSLTAVNLFRNDSSSPSLLQHLNDLRQRPWIVHFDMHFVSTTIDAIGHGRSCWGFTAIWFLQVEIGLGLKPIQSFGWLVP